MNELESDRPMRQPKEADVREDELKQKKHFMNIRINADDQSSRKLIIYSSIIIAAIILVSVLAQYAIPTSIVRVDTSATLSGTPLEGCNNDLIEINNSIVCSLSQSFIKKGQYVNGVVKLNQFVAFYLKINPAVLEFVNEKVYFSLIKVGREIVNNSVVSLRAGTSLAKKEINVSQMYFNQSEFYLDFLKNINQGDEIFWQISLKLNSPLRQFGFSLQTKTINPQYSIFCIAIKSAFFGISLFFVFITTKKHFQANNQCLPEQKITFFLSFMTLFYNDPFYAISILFPNIFTSILSTLFYWNFITVLLLIWIYFLQRINEEQSQFQSQGISGNKIISYVLFYAITYGYRIGSSIYQTFDRPLIDNIYKSNFYLSVTSFLSFVAFLTAMFYIFKLYCTICEERQNLMWRSKVFLYLSFFFFLIVFFLFMIGAFEVFSYSPKKLIFTVTLTNIYSYYLQYLYYESKVGEDQFEAQISNKEPSFIQFEDKDISIDLQKDHFQDFVEYGVSKIQGQNQTTISYLGECLKEQGSKIIQVNHEQK